MKNSSKAKEKFISKIWPQATLASSQSQNKIVVMPYTRQKRPVQLGRNEEEKMGLSKKIKKQQCHMKIHFKVLSRLTISI